MSPWQSRNFSGPQFPHVLSLENDITAFTGLSGRTSEIVIVKSLVHMLTHLVNVSCVRHHS